MAPFTRFRANCHIDDSKVAAALEDCALDVLHISKHLDIVAPFRGSR